MANDGWIEERRAGTLLFRPSPLPPGIVIAVSGRDATSESYPSPTATLARRLARALGLTRVREYALDLGAAAQPLQDVKDQKLDAVGGAVTHGHTVM